MKEQKKGRPIEHEAMKTTIVGGRPPGAGKPVGKIPRGIEVLVKKASIDSVFKTLLLEKRADAAKEIELALEPSEVMMLNAVPREQLESIIAKTTIRPGQRAAFMGKVAALMIVALSASVGCDKGAPREKPSEGIRPDREEYREYTKGCEPDIPPPKEKEPEVSPKSGDETSEGKETSKEEAKSILAPTGIRPDVPNVSEGEENSTEQPKDENNPRQERVTGIRPDIPK